MKRSKQSGPSLRVVVDTNVLISGLLGIKNAPSAQILKAIREQGMVLVMSPQILMEVWEVIGRERIAKLTKMGEREQKYFIEELMERGEVTPGRQLARMVGRDMKDDKFLACACESGTDYLVTGDRDLLVLGAFGGTKILSPRDFVSEIEL